MVKFIETDSSAVAARGWGRKDREVRVCGDGVSAGEGMRVPETGWQELLHNNASTCNATEMCTYNGKLCFMFHHN